MFPSAILHVGVDVSKDMIVVCGPRAATVKTVRNDPAALRIWLAGLPAGAHLICEATGRYYHALQSACAAKSVPLTCLNPAKARYFAQSHGKLEKTDPIDADILRRYGEERRPLPTRQHYQQLRARGKPAKLAYVAVARKLLIYLNSLLRPAPEHTS